MTSIIVMTFQQSDYSFQALVDDIEEERIRWNIPGMAISVVGPKINGHRNVYEHAFGVKQIDSTSSSNNIDLDTVFHIGSDTKLITSFAVAMLVDQRQLQWTQPIKEYWKDFKLIDSFAENNANLIDLLSHRIGVPRADFLMEICLNSTEMRERISHLQPVEQFRDSFIYNNHFLALAGEIVGRKANLHPNFIESWALFLEENIFKRIGLENSYATIEHFLHHSQNFAVSHYTDLFKDMKPNPLPVDENLIVDRVAPAGSVSMSIRDRAKWLTFLLDKGQLADGTYLLSPEAFDQIFTPHNIVKTSPSYSLSTYGLSNWISTYKGHSVISHGGIMYGQYSTTCFFPDLDFGVVALTTGIQLGSDDLCFDVVDRLFFKSTTSLGHIQATYQSRMDEEIWMINENQRQIDSRQPYAPPSLNYSSYCGVYVNQVFGKLKMDCDTDSDAAFVIRIMDAPSKYALNLPVFHFEYDRFVPLLDNESKVLAPVNGNVTFSIESNIVVTVLFQLSLPAANMYPFTDGYPEGILFNRLELSD
ncbi:hypothetical protein HDV02_004293 [Globomyces sp. JEL0801]|nr:hypothetical protein HDV02_004293 [Globomyces sp. JEL0801]